MILFGLLLAVIGLLGGLYLHGYGADAVPIVIKEVTRKNLVTACVAAIIVGVVLILLGLLLP